MGDRMKIGFIGLGTMGGRIAGRFAGADFPLTVFDAAEGARSAFADKHPDAKAATSVGEVFDSSDVVFFSLPGSPQVEAVVEEAQTVAVRGKTIVDLSTSHPDSTRRLASELEGKGCVLMEAPLTGGPPQAEKGELTVIAAGHRDTYENIKSLLEVFGKNIFFVGPSGSGHTIKLVNNSFSGLYVCLYAEVLPLVKRLGIDPEGFMQVIQASGGNSPMFPRFAPKMLNKDFELAFAIELMEKDFSYVEGILGSENLTSGILKAARTLCQSEILQGRARDDVSALVEVSEKA